MHLPTCVDEVLAQCGVCQAFGKAPHAPAAGASTVAAYSEKLQVALLFVGDIIALRIMDVFSKYSFLIPVRTKNPKEVWDALRTSWIGFFAPHGASSLMRVGSGKMAPGLMSVGHPA